MDPQQQLEASGRIWLRGLLSPSELRNFARLCDVGDKPGIRMTLTPALAEFIGPSSAIARAASQAGVDPAPVRIVAFNKSPTSNWAVAWHQDRVIAVDERCDEPGYTNWVMKDDVWHCEPPIELLHNLVFVRVHFDACDENNGAMEIAVGSHRMGLVDARRAKDVAQAHRVEVCRAAPGDVLLVKALTLHRSGSSGVKANRRALRVDYARRRDLAPRLSWSLPEFPHCWNPST